MGLIYDGLFLIILNLFGDYPLDKFSLATSLLNPIDLSRIMILLKLDISALLGYTGALFKKFFGSHWGGIIAFWILIIWTLTPILLIKWKSTKKDF